MKRLLSLVAILAVAATVLPSHGIAGLRGAFDPLTNNVAGADGISYHNGIPNGMQTPALRPGNTFAIDGLARVDRWFAFTTRSSAVGFESSREIWQGLNRSQAGAFTPTILDARSPLLRDPSGVISYTDPAWSPNGRYLAYVQTNAQVTESAIYVQEFMVSSTMATAVTPVGSPILAVPMVSGVRNRHPDWSPDGNSLAYDSDVSGTSIDVFTVAVFPAVGSPVQRTFANNRAEQNPNWAPDGNRIAYDTNKFGPNVIEIVDITTGGLTLAETNFKTISHSNPDWTSDGSAVYYDAPQNEDAQANPNIWRIELATQAKCEISFDGNGDVNVAVSSLVNNTREGIPYNNFLFESQAAGFGLGIWRANPINSCVTPLPMGVNIQPSTINLGSSGDVTAQLTFPPETQAAGYVMRDTNTGGEGVRMRISILPSPTMMGLAAKLDPTTGLPDYVVNQSQARIDCDWVRRTVSNRLVALGLVNQNVPVEVRAYSNITGRTFKGFGFIHIASGSTAGSAVSLQQNAPNPFNPVTQVKFAVSKPGTVALRVYNVRGELVKTIANRHFDAGQHSVSWDGRNASGAPVSSGVYYAKVTTADGASDLIKMVMAK